MLIVVDGSPRQNFGTVNDVVRPSELKSLVIKKADAMYGMRGAGGIMEITLKKAANSSDLTQFECAGNKSGVTNSWNN